MTARHARGSTPPAHAACGDQPDSFGLLRGSSVAMRSVYELLARVAHCGATVLLCGETGTGKDLAARSIHEEGSRAEAPFIVVDCGSIPATLISSELFGHRAGAFTGAAVDRRGAFERAHGGTLFLDEIGELAPALQTKLLRALESRTVTPLGATSEIPVDVRVIAATNRDLKSEIDCGRFRRELYYRIAVVHVEMPPLRSRRSDIPHLAAHILDRLGVSSEETSALLTPAFVARLRSYPWPGNVRELRNYLARTSALGPQSTMSPVAATTTLKITTTEPLRDQRKRWVAQLERRYLEALLVAHAQNVSAAARAAQVNRTHFYRLLSKHGLR